MLRSCVALGHIANSHEDTRVPHASDLPYPPPFVAPLLDWRLFSALGEPPPLPCSVNGHCPTEGTGMSSTVCHRHSRTRLHNGTFNCDMRVRFDYVEDWGVLTLCGCNQTRAQPFACIQSIVAIHNWQQAQAYPELRDLLGSLLYELPLCR